MEARFNLISEPWIRVLKADYSTAEVSLRELFENAHEYRSLAGELPTQDTAMLRLLLAILYAVFLRYAPNGEESPLCGADDYDDDDEAAENALGRWEELWNMKRFPMEPIGSYLETYYDRFWLLHPERPFYQVAELGEGTVATVNKLDSALDKSDNKTRLFTMVKQRERTAMTFAEAARWLVHFVSYSDCSAKKPSPKQTWLGSLEAVYAAGGSLFETLLLNLVMYDVHDDRRLWLCECEEDKPAWERERVNPEKNRKIVRLENPMSVLSIQARKVCLSAIPEEECIRSFYWGAGDYFEADNAFIEQMTVWTLRKKEINYTPKKSNHAKFLWRDFVPLTIMQKNADANGTISDVPGIIKWQSEILDIVGSRSTDLHMVRIEYGTMNSAIKHIDSGELSFHIDLLREVNEHWRKHIGDEVAKAEELANHVSRLAKELKNAGGSGPDAGSAKEQFFYRIDMPFRKWLMSIVPSEDISINDKIKEWRAIEGKLVRALGSELVEQAGSAAYVGREVKEKAKGANKEGVFYCSPKSYNTFSAKVTASLKK